jgi:plasmid stabilization system protein ParE
MNVEFAPRAVADLARIGARSRKVFGADVALALETFIRATIARLAVFPESGQQLPKRPGVWVVPLVRYPFKIFYTVRGDTIIIIHIRHAARRPWNEER